jgi:hypothetical protein
MFYLDIPVDLYVVNHFVSFIETVLLRHSLEHLFVLIEVL